MSHIFLRQVNLGNVNTSPTVDNQLGKTKEKAVHGEANRNAVDKKTDVAISEILNTKDEPSSKNPVFKLSYGASVKNLKTGKLETSNIRHHGNAIKQWANSSPPSAFKTAVKNFVIQLQDKNCPSKGYIDSLTPSNLIPDRETAAYVLLSRMMVEYTPGTTKPLNGKPNLTHIISEAKGGKKPELPFKMGPGGWEVDLPRNGKTPTMDTVHKRRGEPLPEKTASQEGEIRKELINSTPLEGWAIASGPDYDKPQIADPTPDNKNNTKLDALEERKAYVVKRFTNRDEGARKNHVTLKTTVDKSGNTIVWGKINHNTKDESWERLQPGDLKHITLQPIAQARINQNTVV